MPAPAKRVEGAGRGDSGSAPLPFVCALAPQRQELKGPQQGPRIAAADGSPLPAAAATRARGSGACGPARGEGAAGKGGAVWAGGHFRSRDPSLGWEA